MCCVDGHGYNIGATRVSVCITRHYICHPLQGHWVKSVQVKISDIIQQRTRSILVSFPWFLRKYHGTLKTTIINRCSVWDEFWMFKPIRWIKKYSSGSKKRKLRKREDQLIAKVPKLSSFFVPLVTVKGAVHKVRHARLGGGPRRCESA